MWISGIKSWGTNDAIDINSLIKKYQIEGKVVYWGSVTEEQMLVLYEKCDIFVLPTRFIKIAEGLPTVLVEAMAFKKPTIVSNHAGIPELVPSILVPENDSRELANAIISIIDDNNAWPMIGLENRKIVEREYSAEKVNEFANDLMNLLND